MEKLIELLPNEQRVALKLRALYLSFGYEQYSTAKFQPYDVYLANKSFLETENIITFTDGDGRLLALKPDVTTGIVAGLRPTDKIQKLFYVENVFRMDKASLEYREIAQIGIESIGGDAGYAEAEITRLALMTLAEISDSYVLNIGNLGFLNGLIESLNTTEAVKKDIISAIVSKSCHGIETIGMEAGLCKSDIDGLKVVVGLSGRPDEVLKEAKGLCKNDTMRGALSELKGLCAALKGYPASEKLCLDLSLSADVDYYKGLIMQGFVSEFSRAVLKGGRYDNMLKRFGKTQGGLGFALYLGELERAARRAPDTGRNVILIYSEGCSAGEIADAVDGLRAKGFFVCARTEADAMQGKRTFRLTADGVKEC